MKHPKDLASDLTRHWQRHDWRESFFAPGLVILQALTRDGQTASGAGTTRREALERCLGETAEIAALARFRAAGGDFDPWRDGLAAHPDPRRARQAALDEAHERFAVAGWWLGRLRALPLGAGWLDETGLARQLDEMRAGAALRRRTDWWQIPLPQGAPVMICRSMSLEGQDPILGYGSHAEPQKAAAKALRELLLMEMNLMELLAARSFWGAGALEPLGNRIRDFTRRGPQLFAAGAAGPPPATAAPTPEPPCREIGAQDAGISVWLCQPGTAPPVFDSATGQPYL